jgi:hypothetical protein
MKRIATILGVLLGVAVPLATAAPGEAHVAPAPHLSCGELDGHFTNFPAGPQAVTLHYSVDGIEQPPVTQTGVGPAFDTSVGYYNADSGSHVLSARFTWAADGGGSSPIATTTIDRCPPPPTTIVPVPVPTPVPTPVVCTSRRVMEFKVRRRYPGASNTEGALVTRVVKAETLHIGTLPGGGNRTTVRRVGGRFVVRVDFRGVQFTGFNNDTRTTVVLHTAQGNFRTIYRGAQCRSRQGNPNDQGARSPVIPVG